jgi:YD repeat-containing protein
MRADGATFSFERTESGLLRQITGPQSENVRRLSFDGQGRLAWLAEGLGRALVFSRNTRGDLSSLAVQGGPPSLVFDHDESGRLSRIATPGRPAFGAVYGPSGRPEAFTDAIGYRLGLARDRLGRLERIEDGEGRREQFERDASGRPNLWRRADGGETRIEFDPEGNRIEVRPPESRPARFAYDERNLATSETWLASQHQVQYDEFGCVTVRRNGRGQVIRLFYDPLGRPSEIVRETQETARFQNALDGRVLRMTGRDLEYRFGNDERGRPSRVADAHNNVWAEYAFDAKDRVAALAASGGKWLCEYDTFGRLVRMALAGDRLSEVRYAYENDQARLPNRVFLPGGTNVACEYDPYGRIAAIRTTLRSGKTALAERYAYDGRGNVVRIESTDRRLEFEYDAQNRLAVQQLNGHVYARFHYGRDGRLLKMESDEGNLELVYDGDGRPTRSSQARFERDLDGNLTAQVRANGTTRYRFDAAGRLASVTPPTGAAIIHGWSPNGWPIARTQRGQATGLSFLGDLPLYGARRRDNSSGWFVADPLWGAPLAFREGPRTDLAYRDALGRLRLVAEAGRDPIHTIAWGLLGRRSPPDSASFFDSVGLDAVGFDDAENLAGVHDPETGLSLAPRPLRLRLAAYSDGANEPRGTGVPPVNPCKDGETNLIEQIAAACAAGRFAPEEDAILRYLLDSGGSPGWPDPGSDETFDSVLDGGSFLTPSALSRRIVETVLRDGTGGLEASAFAPRAALPAAWTGLGSYRILCPTLTILPPVILEAGLVGETVWRDGPAFAAADNALHGWIGRLMARAADRSGARAGEAGDLRLLGELRELVRWTMNVPNRTEEEKLPVAPEPPAPAGAPAERLALRDRFYSNLDRTP